MSALTLDAGALIAFERGDRALLAILVVARKEGIKLVVPAGALAQVWRDGKKQARLSRLLGSDAVEVEPLTEQRARAAGQLCGVARTSDVVDASVALCARAHGGSLVTSDPDDLLRLDSTLRVIRI